MRNILKHTRMRFHKILQGPGMERKKRKQNIVFKKRYKKCDSCNSENEIASRKCKMCGEIIARKRKTVQDYVPAGSTNATLQKDIIHG